MNVYAAGTEVDLTIPLVDSTGTALTVTAVDYRLIDETGAELIARTALTGFVSGDLEALVTITAGNNAVTVGALRAAREVTLFCTLEEGGEVVLRSIYALEELDQLVIGANSFQTYLEAMLVARDIGKVDGWDAATEDQREAALRVAYDRLCQMAYHNLDGATTPVNAPAGGSDWLYRLSDLDAAELAALPASFMAAIKKAQVAEADDILDADPITQARNKGLMLETIGEVKQMYRGTKPLLLPVSRRAAEYVGRYVSFAAIIGRA